MSNILEIKNLNKSYKDFSLRDINLSIPKGSIMGLVGENGSGKTSTIKAILNIVNRDSGEIEIFGLDNIENEIEIKENIGVVLDNCCFQDNLNIVDIDRIMENIYSQWDSKVFFNYTDRFKLKREQKVKEYSKGMKMKVSIAVALSHKAKLLILDEPTAGLDPIVRNEILDELLEFIQDEEHSILFSTHITSDLDKIADYITLIHDGEVLLSKDRESLLTDFGLLKCGREDFEKIGKTELIGYKKSKFGYEALVSNRENINRKYPNLIIDSVNIEDIMLFYTRGE